MIVFQLDSTSDLEAELEWQKGRVSLGRAVDPNDLIEIAERCLAIRQEDFEELQSEYTSLQEDFKTLEEAKDDLEDLQAKLDEFNKDDEERVREKIGDELDQIKAVATYAQQMVAFMTEIHAELLTNNPPKAKRAEIARKLLVSAKQLATLSEKYAEKTVG